MNKNILIAKSTQDFYLQLKMANRHGLIAGATGTGKTVTLQSLAEQMSLQGIPVFLADVKGDLSGISQAGGANAKVDERFKQLNIKAEYQAFPVVYWDLLAKHGHPLRATVSDLGPLLMARLLNLNDVQSGVLTMIFKIADDQGLLLLDLKDLRAMIQYVGDHAANFTTTYGNISKASIGTIQRGILELESQGAASFFGEPMLDIFDLIQTVPDGRGVINILAAHQLIQRPKVYATFLLWLLAELFEQLPEVGDLSKPKFVFFFDEAHLLFDDAPDALIEKIEQVVRLVRSKGVGIYFITQNPKDVPDKVLAQLGNRIQHALRAFTPQDQKAIKAMAMTYRSNPSLNIEDVMTQLAVGEALVSLLDEQGSPSVVERAFIVPPMSRLGVVSDDERMAVMKASVLYGSYERVVDRESAFELLAKRLETKPQETAVPAASTRTRVAPKTEQEKMIGAFATSAVRAIGSQLGRQIIRGVLGSLLSGKRR